MDTNPYLSPQSPPELKKPSARKKLFNYWWQPYGCLVQIIGWCLMSVAAASSADGLGLKLISKEIHIRVGLIGFALLTVPGLILMAAIYRNWGKQPSANQPPEAGDGR